MREEREMCKIKTMRNLIRNTNLTQCRELREGREAKRGEGREAERGEEERLRKKGGPNPKKLGKGPVYTADTLAKFLYVSSQRIE